MRFRPATGWPCAFGNWARRARCVGLPRSRPSRPRERSCTCSCPRRSPRPRPTSTRWSPRSTAIRVVFPAGTSMNIWRALLTPQANGLMLRLQGVLQVNDWIFGFDFHLLMTLAPDNGINTSSVFQMQAAARHDGSHVGEHAAGERRQRSDSASRARRPRRPRPRCWRRPRRSSNSTVRGDAGRALVDRPGIGPCRPGVSRTRTAGCRSLRASAGYSYRPPAREFGEEATSPPPSRRGPCPPGAPRWSRSSPATVDSLRA